MWIIYTGELGHFPENTLIKIPRQKTQFGSDSSELRSTDMDVFIYLFWRFAQQIPLQPSSLIENILLIEVARLY